MLTITDLSVTFGEAKILHKVSLEVTDGEVVAVLGPSGSGKSTLLRAVAGLVDISSGEILWNGIQMMGVPTHLRDFGLMFQRYALFPHLDVAGNVGFGLRMKDFDDIEGRVSRALDWVGMAGFESRPVDSLSGGERQRVALARTLAPEPRLVMLDEPLGALDRNLRLRLVGDIRTILTERGVTALVVTHDRDEAAAMSDRLALMRDGRLVQSGTIDSMLAQPADRWVVDFLS